MAAQAFGKGVQAEVNGRKLTIIALRRPTTTRSKAMTWTEKAYARLDESRARVAQAQGRLNRAIEAFILDQDSEEALAEYYEAKRALAAVQVRAVALEQEIVDALRSPCRAR